MRELIEDLGWRFAVSVRTEPLQTGPTSALHTGQSAEVLFDGRRVGIIGSLAPMIIERVNTNLSSVVYCEFDLARTFAIIDEEKPRPKRSPRSSVAMKRQLSFWLTGHLTVGALMAALESIATNRAEQAWITLESTFDRGDGTRGVTVSVTLDRSEWRDRATASDTVLSLGEEVAAALGADAELRSS
jgi:phenylalanyl-tRNA synthetase beta subunit